MFVDFVGGGGWGLLVGGVICVVNWDKEGEVKVVNSGGRIWWLWSC